MSKILVTGWK